MIEIGRTRLTLEDVERVACGEEEVALTAEALENSWAPTGTEELR